MVFFFFPTFLLITDIQGFFLNGVGEAIKLLV